MKLVSALCACLLIPFTAAADSPLTARDLVGLKTVRSVAMAPGGAAVAYVVSTPRTVDEKPGGAHVALYVWKAGSGSRRYSAEGTSVSGLSWTPNGSALLFTSKRGKGAKTQVWRLPLGGGEAVPITDAPEGVSAYEVASDGKSIAYFTTDPKDEDEKDGRDATVQTTREGLLIQEHRHRRLVVQALDDEGDPVAVTAKGVSAFEADWSPNGKQIAVMTAASPLNDDNYMFRSLVVVNADGATKKSRVLAQKMGKMVSPRWSPDGKRVAFRAAGKLSDGTTGTLWVVDADGKSAPRALNPAAEETVYDFAWVDDDALIVSAVRGTRSHLSRRTLGGKTQPLIEQGPVFLGFSLSADGTRIALAGHTAAHPSELFVGTLGSPLQRVTRLNPVLEDRAMGRQSTIQWTATDGTRIEGVLVEPVGGKKNAPLIQMVHGGPEWQSLDGWTSNYLTAAQVLAGRGYAVLFPNYRGSAGRGVAFATADHRDLGGAEFQDCIDAIPHLASQGLIDPRRVGMIGGSYGGYMSALAATKGSREFAAAIEFAGIGNWISFMGTSDIPHEMSLVHWDLYCLDRDNAQRCWEASPLAHVDENSAPLMVVHGVKDLRVPLGQAHELFTGFRMKKAPAELVLYPREGHGLRERGHQLDLIERTLEWFERHVAKKGRR